MVRPRNVEYFAAKDVAMARAGCQFVVCLFIVAIIAGCRTPQPVLKPPPQPEILSKPPTETRFQSSQFPDMAFRDMNSQFRKPLDSGGGGIIPARGNMGSPGGMMPAGGMGPAGMGGGYR
jgi:hypothetical protein